VKVKKKCTTIIRSRRTQKEIRFHWEKDWRIDDICSCGSETELHSRQSRKNLKTQSADIRKQEVQWQRVRAVGVLGSADTKT
jgi:hypothetical protein